MNSLAITAAYAQNIDGYQHVLSPVSMTGRWKMEMSSADQIVYGTVNGGAWFPIMNSAGIIIPGGGGTLNADYGNGPAGNTISMTDALGAITLSSARTSGTILGITTTNAPGTVAGAITAIAIDMSSLGTAATPATVNLPALTIVGAHSSVAKARGSGLVTIVSGYRSATAISCLVRNKQALAGSLVMLGWDSTNYEGLPATSSILTDVTHMVTLDGQTSVDAATNNVSFVGLRVLVPSTTSTSAAGVAVESLSTSTSAGMSVTMSPGSAASVRGVYSYLGANATGSCFYADFAGGGTTGIVNVVSSSALTLQLQGLRVDFSGVTAGANLVYGAQIIMPSVTNTSAISMRLGGHATAVGLEMETGGSLAVSTANEGRLRYNSGTQTFQVSQNAAAWISLATTGTGGTVTLDNAYIGGRTITVTAAIGSVQFTSTQTSGTIFDINSAATLGGSLYGINMDLSSVVPGAIQIRGAEFTLPASTSSNTRGIYVNSLQRSGSGIYVNMAGTVGVVDGFTGVFANNGLTNDSKMMAVYHGVFNNQWYSYYSQSQGGQSTTTHYYAEWTPTDRGNALSTGTISGLRAHFAPTSTYYTNNWSNIDVRGLYFTSAPVCSGADPGGIVNYNAWGVYVSHAPTVSGGSAQITTDNFTAFYATVAPTSTGGGTRPVKGIQIDMGSACSNTAFGAKFNWGALAGTASGNGVVNINTNVSGTTTGALTMLEIGADTSTLTLGAALTGLNLNLSTNVTAGAQTVLGVNVAMPASSSSSTSILNCASAQTAGYGAIMDMTGNLSGAITGLLIAFSGTGGSQTVKGADISLQSSLSSSSRAILVTVGTTGTHQMEFASVTDGTYFHILGPTAGQLRIGAGLVTGTANGREVAIIGSAASTSGTGGAVYITGGAGAGGTSAGGGIVLTGGAGVSTGTSGYVQAATAFAENSSAVSYTASGTTTINTSLGNLFTATVATGVTTWAFSNPPTSGYVTSFTLVLTNGGLFAQTWPGSVKWPGGGAPVLTASGVDVLVFFTADGGTTWRGVLAQSDSK